MLESGLEVIAYNCNRKNNDLRLYEFGKTYTQHNDKYIEVTQLAMWITGEVKAAHWNQKAQKADVFYVKGIIRNLLLQSGIKGTVLAYEESDGNMSISWKWKNKVLCTVTSVGTKRLQEFDVKQEVYYAVIDWKLWLEAMSANKIKYQEVPKFPAVQRDLAIVLDTAVNYQQVQQATEQLKLDALQSFDLFDVFESEKLGAGKKSYALSYTFQLQDRTLTDSEIEQIMGQLMTTYKTKLQALIRE